MKNLFLIVLLSVGFVAHTQNYKDSITRYQENYIINHEVVKGDDRKAIHFFQPDSNFKVVASFEKKENMPWFSMPTSARKVKIFRVYGVASFSIHDTIIKINLYQSQNLMNSPEYKEWLFLPFTDGTTGKETYDGGRYIDLKTEDIKDGKVVIDFNKAYNPYCAYVSGVYNCPIPPKENHLLIFVRAGEMMYQSHK
jgi:uncharacterized protein (DUF1684 family)